jgi:NTP pyrophosphatase (non-canonical NTP hydrolase)
MFTPELRQRLLEFRKERDWEQFHTPKELAIALVLESSELLETFQWKKDQEVTELLRGPNKELLLEEVADIAAYLFYLCHDLGIDLNAAVGSKLTKNRSKYPADKVRGCAKKYSEY